MKMYKVAVICKNCRFGATHNMVVITIPKGTSVDEYIKTAICKNCGCTGTFSKNRGS